MLTSAEFKLER